MNTYEVITFIGALCAIIICMVLAPLTYKIVEDEMRKAEKKAYVKPTVELTDEDVAFCLEYTRRTQKLEVEQNE